MKFKNIYFIGIILIVIFSFFIILTVFHIPVYISSEIYSSEINEELELYIFQTENHENLLRKTLVFFHGGGWKYGTPNEFQKYAAYFARKGYICICPAYRKISIDNPTPEGAVTDAVNAYNWILSNSERLKIDKNEVILIGGSAGGHLSYWVTYYNVKKGFPPKALILLDAIIDTTETGYGAELFAEKAKAWSPTHNVIEQFPRTLIVHSEKDVLITINEVNKFYNKMKAVGNNIELSTIKNIGHGSYYWGDYKRQPDVVHVVNSWLTE